MRVPGIEGEQSETSASTGYRLDAARLEAVRRVELLDTPAEAEFDRLTRIAAELLDVPVAFISIVDERRDFYKSCYGFDASLTQEREMTGTTFCHYAIESDVPLVINDTGAHPVYSKVPTVRSLGVAAYLGIPLKLSTGEVIGSFCAVDSKPRQWSERDGRIMSELALSAMREIELRLSLRATEERAAEAESARLLATRSEADVRSKQELILGATADGVFGLSADGRVSFVNPAAAAILDWPPEELLGRDQHQHIHRLRADGSPYPVEECPIYQVLRDGVRRTGAQEVFLRRDGTSVPVEFTSQAIVEEGKITGAVITFRDITARLLAEARAAALADERTARAMLEATARARDEFFAVISHELRTPMTSIRGWVTVLRDGESDEPTRQMALDAIDTSSRMQAQLIDDLLDITRISSGKLQIDLRPVDLHDVVRDSVAQLLPDAEARGIRIRMSLMPQRVMVRADVRRMQQVVNNILSNALKFTPRGGLVTLETSRDEEQVTVQISDTGTGIEPAMLESIFVPYRQAENAAYGGLGLGLSIVRHLVEAHGGSVWAESEGRGLGARFFVRLPLDKGETAND